jgi:hypothetical protein
MTEEERAQLASIYNSTGTNLEQMRYVFGEGKLLGFRPEDRLDDLLTTQRCLFARLTVCSRLSMGRPTRYISTVPRIVSS